MNKASNDCFGADALYRGHYEIFVADHSYNVTYNKRIISKLAELQISYFLISDQKKNKIKDHAKTSALTRPVFFHYSLSKISLIFSDL